MLLHFLLLCCLAADPCVRAAAAACRGGVRGVPHWGLWMQRNTAFGANMIAFLAEGGARWMVGQGAALLVSSVPEIGSVGWADDGWAAVQLSATAMCTHIFAHLLPPRCWRCLRHPWPADDGGGAADGQCRRV